ncbi:MAG: hypothetical protein R3D29_02840 [Nitratireductor sp.]
MLKSCSQVIDNAVTLLAIAVQFFVMHPPAKTGLNERLEGSAIAYNTRRAET